MTIGFDGSRAFVNGRTGTENYSFQLLKALARLASCLAARRARAKRAKIDKKNEFIVYIRPGVKTGDKWPKNFQFKVINWPRLWTQVGLALQTFKDPLDVLFVPAHTLPLFRKPGLKTVVTVHDLGSEYLPSMHQLKQRLYLGLMQKFQLKTATKIISVSKATKIDLTNKLGIDPKKIRVVYEGYDKKEFKVKNSELKIDRQIDTLRSYDLDSKSYFLFVGTIQPRKNLERLIKAFSLHLRGERRTSARTHLGGVTDKLIIAGSKGWLSDEIYALPKKLGIEERVKFLGYVPDEDLPALYKGSIALTFPSLFEGFGLPILEAQSLGVPVLTSNVSSMPEVAGKGAVFVDPYSIDDIVEGMEKVQSSILRLRSGQEFKVQIIKAGFENVKRFSWEKCARETLEVVESL